MEKAAYREKAKVFPKIENFYRHTLPGELSGKENFLLKSSGREVLLGIGDRIKEISGKYDEGFFRTYLGKFGEELRLFYYVGQEKRSLSLGLGDLQNVSEIFLGEKGEIPQLKYYYRPDLNKESFDSYQGNTILARTKTGIPEVYSLGRLKKNDKGVFYLAYEDENGKKSKTELKPNNLEKSLIEVSFEG